MDGARQTRGGFVMISVLFVLVALLILVAPFLMTSRNANHHSMQLADRAQERLALDSAARHARNHLAYTHSLNSSPVISIFAASPTLRYVALQNTSMNSHVYLIYGILGLLQLPHAVYLQL